MDQNRKEGNISVVTAIFVARTPASIPQNSPASVAAFHDAVGDAKRIVERVERSFQPSR